MEILLIILAVMLASLAAVMGSVALVIWGLHRHNRVSPSAPTGAPLVWLCSPSTPARTHRRLRTAAATARTVPRRPEAPTHSPSALSVELEQQAVQLDHWVVWTSKAPSRWRRDHYRAIQRQVKQLESLTMRLTTIEDTGPDHSVDDSRRALDEVAERLGQLEAAQAEVQALERLALGTTSLPLDPRIEGSARQMTPARPADRPAPPPLHRA